MTHAYVTPEEVGCRGPSSREEAGKDVEMEREETFAKCSADLDAYLDALQTARVYTAREVFSPCVAWLNRNFIGMKAFGGGKNYKEGCIIWKYFGYHFILLVGIALGFLPPLYVAGFSYYAAATISFSYFSPIVFTTPFVESKIFRSWFLALHISRYGEKVKAIRRGSTFVQFLMFLSTMCFSFGGVLAVGLFWAYPYAVLQGNFFLQYCVIASIAICSIVGILSFGFQFWQPLVEMHQMEITNATVLTSKGVQAILFSKNLEPRVARRKLSELTRKIIRPLQYDLHIWGLEVLFMIVFVFTCIALSAWLVAVPLKSRHPEVAWPGEVFRYGNGILWGVATPAALTTILKSASKPHDAWAEIDDCMMDADLAMLACDKFDGNLALLKDWFGRNRLTLRLLGMPVDHTLPGRLAGAMASLVVTAALVLSRTTLMPQENAV